MKKSLLVLLAVALLSIPAMAFAHSPIFDCFDNGDGTVTCQGGFSDGSSASGVKVYVKDGSGAVLETLSMDANSEVTIKKPAGAYSMEMDAGEGHSINVSGDKIVE